MRMVPFSITLNDPEPRFQSYAIIWLWEWIKYRYLLATRQKLSWSISSFNSTVYDELVTLSDTHLCFV